ncbi:major facilitator superfamily domain-containing protein [Gorgonomyces haynaldii]|nr:major facilitator superfamily domain-containing protein [Gorgonomyces haynaldii]
MFFVFIDSSQAFLLKENLGIKPDDFGSATALVATTSEITIILACGLWGLLSDLSGRHITFSLGFALMALGLFLYPTATSLGLLLLYRVIFALGAANCSTMLTACLGDVILEDDRGKGAGLSGLTSGAGALIGLFVFLPLPVKIGVKATFYIVGGIGIVFALLTFFGLYRWIKWSHLESDEDKQFSWKKYFENAWEATKDGITIKDPLVYLGYFTSFVARADSTAITLFIPLWTYHYYLETGKCVGNVESPDFKDLCRDAYVKASILSGIAQTFALIAAPFYGFVSDRIKRPIIVSFSGLCCGLGYLLSGLSKNPTEGIDFFYVVLIGVGEIGLIISAITLATHKNVPDGSRGGIAGVNSLCGGFGILFISLAGGTLFDSWFAGAPFIILAILNFLLAVVSMLVFVFAKPLQSSEEVV